VNDVESNRPLVTVIVVSFNHERFITGCLDSIAAQTFTDFELVIVDDHSTDESASRAEEWVARSPLPARVIVNPVNRGICASLNRAIRETNSEFISYVSADDEYTPRKIELQVGTFRGDSSDVAVVYGDVRVIDGAGNEIEASWFADGRHGDPPTGRVFERLIERTNFVPAPSAMIRRSALAGVGGYDESMLVEDLDTWLRLAAEYEFRFVPQVVAAWRRLPTSLSNDHSRIGRLRLSRARALDKWVGRSAALDHAILQRNWRSAMHTLSDDPEVAQEIMRMVLAHDDTTWRRAVARVARVPGAGALVSTALSIKGAVRHRRR